MAKNPDVAVVGGGVVGTAIAWRLAQEGRSVAVLERGEIGREASWAAGGILTPVHLADYPAAPRRPLRRERQALPRPRPRARATTPAPTPSTASPASSSSNGTTSRPSTPPTSRPSKRKSGTSRSSGCRSTPSAPSSRGSPTTSAAASSSPTSPRSATRAWPSPSPRPRAKKGVEIRPNSPVTGFLRVPGRVNGVRTAQGDVYAGTTIIAAGAWSADVLKPLGLTLAVKPMKGQILLTQAAAGLLLGPIIEAADTYLIPRADGKILIGSTLEDVGFDKTVTLDALGSLSSRAAAILPALGKLPLVTCWAGLRPSTPDRLPYIGKTGPLDGLLVATGHFRNGILLAPITAELVADLLAGQPPSIDLAPFDPLRRYQVPGTRTGLDPPAPPGAEGGRTRYPVPGSRYLALE